MRSRSLLHVVETAANFKSSNLISQRFTPFFLSLKHTSPQDTIGQIPPDVAEKIISSPEGSFSFDASPRSEAIHGSSSVAHAPQSPKIRAIAFGEHLKSPQARTEAIEKVCLNWRTTGLFAHAIGGRQWRNEKYAIYPHPFKNIGPEQEVAFTLERSACELFGLVSYGAHMTMYTPDYKIWVPRRSKTKQTWPGFLDNSVAGGIPNGTTPFESMIKECEEEAGLAPYVCRKAVKPVGATSYIFQNSKGNLHPEVKYVYDMLCPSGDNPAFVPKPLDGEVESFKVRNDLDDSELPFDRLNEFYP